MNATIDQSAHEPRTESLEAMPRALYGELRRIAARHLNTERRNHTLQPTALVHEAYLKLAGTSARVYSNDAHFVAVASRAMRQILVDHARSRRAQKRLGDKHCSLEDMGVEVSGENGAAMDELLRLDAALTALAGEGDIFVRLIEMRYFGGMTAEESAEALGISAHVARHHLRYAHAWLRRQLS